MTKVMCVHCKGSGMRQEYLHIEGGKCYPCEGLGYVAVNKEQWNKLTYVRPNGKSEEEIEIRIHRIKGEPVNGFVIPRTRSQDVWAVIGERHRKAFFDPEYPEDVFDGADVIRMWTLQFVSNGFKLKSNVIM